MSYTRRNILLFLLALSVFTAFVQWDGASHVLDQATGGIPWSVGLIAFFKSNTQGLLQLVALGLYLEFVGIGKSKDRERKETELVQSLLERSIKTSSDSALLHLALAGRFGEEAATKIGHEIFKPCPVLRNLSVRIKIRNCVEGFEIQATLSYSKQGDDYLIAVTEEPLECEALISTGVLSEVFVASQGIADAIPVKVRKRVKLVGSDSYSYHDLEFSPLTSRAKKLLFRNTALQRETDRLRIFEGNSTTLRGDPESPVHFEIVHTNKQPAEYPFTFWMSDRPLEVQFIEVDFSSLSVQQQQGARLHLFMSSLGWSHDVVPSSAVWRFPVQSWLLPGQGIAIVWPRLVQH